MRDTPLRLKVPAYRWKIIDFIQLLTLVVLVFPGTVTPGEIEITNCVDQKGTPDKYTECIARLSRVENDEAFAMTQEPIKDEPCYCDIRKQRQVEIRLKKLQTFENKDSGE